MNSVFKKTVFGLMTLFFIPYMALALDAEYKNSLTKVELKQTSETSYDVNLYMQKKFTEPVKVIKKNDLNYYILLPETKNSASGISKQGTDIKEAGTSSHKYAGADVNNGYTKININTTKPMNFNINVKNSKDTTAAKNATTRTTTVATTSRAAVSSQAQKKNSDFQLSKKQVTLKSKQDVPVKKPVVQQVNKGVKKPVQPAKVAIKPTKPLQKQVQKPIQKPVQKQVQAPKAVQKQPQKPVQKQVQPIKTAQKPAQKPVQKPIQQPIQQQTQKAPIKQAAQPKPVAPVAKAPVQEVKKNEVKQNEIKQEDIKPQEIKDDIPPILKPEVLENETTVSQEDFAFDETNKDFQEMDSEFNSSFLDRFTSKITEYGLSLNDIIFMLVASLISIIALIIILRKPNSSHAKLKTKADLIEKLDKTERLVPKKTKETEEEGEGKYFVFDKNVKQTAFSEPSTLESKKHYELSNYEPDLNIKYGTEVATDVATKESEYDIIQKILKEDSLVEIAPGEFEPKIYAKRTTAPKEEEAPVVAAPTNPIKREAPTPSEQIASLEKKVNQPAEVKPPVVLSNIEIAPERGFMVVSYNNNVSLMGYIFDDVFALYNFKRPSLANPEIKYRLSDKDDKGTNFIIKVETTKVVVRVTKSQMNLLVVM